jgi:hypothetical protein
MPHLERADVGALQRLRLISSLDHAALDTTIIEPESKFHRLPTDDD